MGTVLEITLVAADREQGRAVLDELFALAERLEAVFTTWRPESDLSRLNAAAGAGFQSVDVELARLLRISARYTELTRGSFDVTVGPLVELWREAGRRGTLPTAQEIERARQKVGAHQLRLGHGGRVALAAGSSVNLGGVAKGYALDRMLLELDRRGIERALLSFGQSSTWAVGRPTDAPGWRLLALGPADAPLGVLTLEDRALSVSGSLGQWVEVDGRRYGHVLDPRSGQPLTRRRQALVVTRDASLAEALSKALLVLGEQEGMELIEAQPDCEALLADADGRSWRSPGWDTVTRFEALERPAP
jgi:thiamine biosynthesis lipoprotein